MTDFTTASSVVELGGHEVTEIAGVLAHLEFFQVRLVLVAGGATDFLAFDLILLVKMGLMNKRYLFRKFDLFGFEIITGLTMTVGGRARSIIDTRAHLDDWTTDFHVGEVLGRLFGQMAGDRGFGNRFGFFGPIMTSHTAHLVMFAFFPKFILFFNDSRIS